MCHMLFTPFIFVRRRCSLVSLSPSILFSFFSRSRIRHYICFAHRRSYFLAPSSSLPFYPKLLPLTPRCVASTSCSRSLSSIFATLSLSLSAGLLAAISPRCYSFLALSRFSFLSFPRAFSESRSSLISVSLLLATSLILFSVLLAPLSSPSLPFRLLVYTLVTRALSHRLSLSLSFFPT